MQLVGGTDSPQELAQLWRDPFSAAALCADLFPSSSIDGYPWALQHWDGRRRVWCWDKTGIVPQHHKDPKRALTALARDHGVTSCPVRLVWVRHWTPERRGNERGWRACIDTNRTIGPVRV